MVLAVGLAATACSDDASGPERQWKLGESAGARGIAYVDGAIWVGVSDQVVTPQAGETELLRIDPADGSVDLRVGQRLDVHGVVDGDLWVGSSSVDPSTGKGSRSIDHPFIVPATLVAAGGALYVIDFGEVTEFDLESGAKVATVAEPGGDDGETIGTYSDAAVGAGDLLVIETDVDGVRSIAALDVVQGAYRWTYPLPKYIGPASMAVSGGTLWALLDAGADSGVAQSVVAFDLETGEVVAQHDLPAGTAQIGDDPNALQLGPDGTPWALVHEDGVVLRIDPETAAAVASFTFSTRPIAFTVSEDAVFTVSNGSGVLTRVLISAFTSLTAPAG